MQIHNMVKRKGVTLIVDEKFFSKFEVERQREQVKLRNKVGGVVNLTQRKFTAMLAARDFNVGFPKQPKRLIKRKRIK